MNNRVLKGFTGVMVLFAMLAGCAAVEPLQTPSGKPEITIPEVTGKEAILALTDLMIDKGYIIKTLTDDNAVYYKKTFRLYALPPYGPKPGEMPEARVSYDIKEEDGRVRIAATLWLAIYPGRPYTGMKDISRGRDGHTIQNYLEGLKASMAP
jgi:hypothetical protein